MCSSLLLLEEVGTDVANLVEDTGVLGLVKLDLHLLPGGQVPVIEPPGRTHGTASVLSPPFVGVYAPCGLRRDLIACAARWVCAHIITDDVRDAQVCHPPSRVSACVITRPHASITG